MSKSILVVEDDQDLLSIYQEILEMKGFQVAVAKDGVEGIQKFIEFNPSLVIMDVVMPVLDGYGAFYAIKKIDKNANVVIITGFSEFTDIAQAAIKNGLIKVISKPLGVKQLVELANKYSEIEVEK
jgi:DNA-binding NtrC family response regulator